MKQQTYSKNIILILAASFFYFASPMLVTPLITGFSGSIGASAGVMGVIGGLMNLCSLFCRLLLETWQTESANTDCHLLGPFL